MSFVFDLRSALKTLPQQSRAGTAMADELNLVVGSSGQNTRSS